MRFFFELIRHLAELPEPVNHCCDNSDSHRYLCSTPNADGVGDSCTGIGIAIEEPKRITCKACRAVLDHRRTTRAFARVLTGGRS